jgi:DNA-binding NarL/FixJ family response regulator
MIKVAVFEDRPELREGLAELLTSAEDIQFCGAWENCNHVQRLVQQHQPDVVLMDIEMPGVNGLQGLQLIKKISPQINVVILTVFENNENLFNALCLGANGYLLKSTPPLKIIEAVKEVYAGGAPMTASIATKVLQSFASGPEKTNHDYALSPREKDILGSLVKGNSYKMIASELGISIDTVRTHIRKIYDKLHVHSMNEAVAKAIHNRIV